RKSLAQGYKVEGDRCLSVHVVPVYFLSDLALLSSGAILRRARIASSGAVAQIFGSGSRVGGRSKLSRRAESILDGILHFFYEYRLVTHCDVRGGGVSGTSLLLASARGYSRHRVGRRLPVRSQAQMASAPARENFGEPQHDPIDDAALE